jgi:hypothetical protein
VSIILVVNSYPKLKMQCFNMTLFLTVATIVGLCNASPHLIRRDQLPGARVIEIAARETGSPVLNSTIPLNATSSESVTASVTDTAPAATDPPTSTICITMMMQVDYLQCGKRKG